MSYILRECIGGLNTNGGLREAKIKKIETQGLEPQIRNPNKAGLVPNTW